MSAKPLISILTPVYNHRLYIEQTIASVLKQTYQKWEWVILDDGSTDGVGDIIKSYKDSRIKYFYQEHAGMEHLTGTYNKVLTMCHGELIAMLDSDDYWPENKLELQVKSFDDPDIVLSYGECSIINEKGKNIYYFSIPEDRHVACNDPVGSSLKLFILKRKSFINNSTVVLRTKALLNIGGFVEAEGLSQDLPTWTNLSLEGRFAAFPVCLNYWRRHPSSTNLARKPEVLFYSGLNFLKEFTYLNEQKLKSLGFYYDSDTLEKHWKTLNPNMHYYTRAIILINSGLFNEAKAEFKGFLDGDPSMKNKLIFLIFRLSSLIKFDLVNPIANLKSNLMKSNT
jgi:glycosyltransferase involved in cell wall biosynthesis